MKRIKPKSLFGQAVVLIMFAVIFAALFSRIERVWELITWIARVLAPLTVGAVIAFFMNVPMRGIERLFARMQKKRGKEVRVRGNSILALVLTYLLVPLAIFLVFYIIIPQVIEAVPGIVASVESAWPKVLSFMHRYNIDTGRINEMLASINWQKIFNTITENLETIVTTSVTAVSSVFSAVTTAITGFVISIYILGNKHKLMAQAKKLLYAYTGPNFTKSVIRVASLTNQTFTDFLSGQCIESLILGTMFFLVMTILRMPFALVISVFVAVTALIPYVGAVSGCVLGALLILTDSPGKALVFVLASFVIQQVENQLIYPKVVGTSVGLPPLWILVAVFVGGKMSGLAGMIFFIPVVSVAYSLIRANVADRLKRKSLVVDEDGSIRSGEEENEPPAEQTEEAPPEAQ